MSRTKTTKTICHDDKRCILIWDSKEYGLTILTMENSKNVEWYGKPVFYIPLRVFMRCGAFWSALHLSTIFWEPKPYHIERPFKETERIKGFWSALHLSTIFWEPKPYHIERPFKETERIKGAYLIAFAPDIAPICKGWAQQCIDALHDMPRNPETDNVFVEIIVFQDSLKKEIMDAAQQHELQVYETDKKDIFNVFES